MTVRRLSTDSPWTIRRTISGLIQAVAHSYFLATNNSKRLKTVANFSKAEIRKALQFLTFQAIPQRLTTAKMPLVRMRSAVRIRPAAPKSIENLGFRCFFVAKTLKMVWVKMWVNRLTHTVTHIGNQRLCRLLPAHAPWVQRNARKEPKSTGEEIASFPVLCLPAGLIESAP